MRSELHGDHELWDVQTVLQAVLRGCPILTVDAARWAATVQELTGQLQVIEVLIEKTPPVQYIMNHKISADDELTPWIGGSVVPGPMWTRSPGPGSFKQQLTRRLGLL
ncbi:hypothetical protein [Spongiactinospora gelatinilytica]|uniref:hypothetical protein n=1 Tax=Spongiactinospora gelatinilytica TaxID=2666298 RepID=UPI0011B94255|nr:hypothetical protein [Spongiactinospora gelatinilytica]